MATFFELFGKNMRSIIALSIVWLSFTFLFILCFHAVPKDNVTVVNIAAGLILAGLGAVAGYYFGSSKDKSDKEKAEIVQTQIEATK